MRKMMIAALAALSLSACATTGTGPPAAPSQLPSVLAPLAGTHVDDEVIKAAWRTADAALYGVDLMRSLGWIVDGSPKAHAVADAAERVKRWLIAADEAQQAGQQPNAVAAYAQASTAYAALLAALER
ncbi:MAG: hypothetical protein J0H88_08330 [Sphingomonadales bacterium]|nr:hypothetical protein [Sphingomonadales bacterium]